MELGMSLDIRVPQHIDPDKILELGIRHCPYEEVHGMDVHEAVRWAFFTPDGVRELHELGVRWHAEETGRATNGNVT